MNIALWIVQVLLAMVFLLAGIIKLTQPRPKLAERMAWVQDFSDRQVKAIGSLEILAAIGLTVPAALHIASFLAPLAAAGLVLLMLGAAATHARRSEPQGIATNVVLLLLAAVVALGRFGPYHFQ
jgi:uncharacterized membrane protein YphA (DoxX/SURF4 family)